MIAIADKNEEQKILTVSVTGRVDSSNAVQLGSELETVQKENPDFRIVLNVKDMPYIQVPDLGFF